MQTTTKQAPRKTAANRRKLSPAEREAIEQEALNRARGNKSLANYAAIIEGFLEKGIPADQIVPRVNVLTYNAWRAAGRQVRRGEKGVKVFTWIVTDGSADDSAGDRPVGSKSKKPRAYCTSATVFHISQTDAIG